MTDSLNNGIHIFIKRGRDMVVLKIGRIIIHSASRLLEKRKHGCKQDPTVER